MGQRLASEGQWWRFSGYEIRDGCVQPSARARLETWDPWASWETRNLRAGQEPATAQPVYQSLMRLVQEVKFKPGTRRFPDSMTPESLSRITAWCEQYGPLGVLLSRWEDITVAPIARASGTFFQRRYVRGIGQVVQEFRSSGDLGENKPRVFIHGLDDLSLQVESPSETWGRFFPSISRLKRDAYQYPKPYSDEFRLFYAEPVMEFWKAARLLGGAMLHLQRSTQPTAEDQELGRDQALDTLNLLRRPVTSVFDLDRKENATTYWESPSLMASLAEMYVQDRMCGRGARICSCCGAPFISRAYQAAYCSLSCRHRDQKRRLRKQTAEAETLRAEGQTILQIAATLGQDPKVVARRLAKS